MRLHGFGLGAVALAVALLAAGCGQAQESEATLSVNSVPKAEVFVDGTRVGASGEAITLAAGEHKLEVRHDRFITHEETVTVRAGGELVREVTLAPEDPSDPVVIAALAACEGVDVEPFIAPETHRGSRDKRAPAVLLWPAKDIREKGLVNYAIEADETYDGDAILEFRRSNKVIYREAFKPESITTIRPIPAEVREQIKVGRKITWGLYFEDSRRPIKTWFKVVSRPKADRQLAKLATSRHMQRQPKITQELMAATVLQNNRLYTEALAANLQIAADHPNSTQPYRGIVQTLRRLDAEDSELFAFVSPFVSGKGGNSGINTRPAAGGDLGIGAWSPSRAGALPTPIADATGTNPGAMGPGGAGVTPQGGTTQPREDGASEPTPADDGVPVPTAGPEQGRDPAVAAGQAEKADRMAKQLERMAQEVTDAKSAATDANARREAAESEAQAAEAAFETARKAVEGADDPTDAQVEAMAEAGRAAELAREAADAAGEAADQASKRAADLESRYGDAAKRLEDLTAPREDDARPADGLQAEKGNGAERTAAEKLAHHAERTGAELERIDADLGAAQETAASLTSAGEAAAARMEAAEAAHETLRKAMEGVEEPTEAQVEAIAKAEREVQEAREANDSAQKAAAAANQRVEDLQTRRSETAERLKALQADVARATRGSAKAPAANSGK